MARHEWHLRVYAELSEIIDDEVMAGIRHFTHQRGSGWSIEVVFDGEDAKEIERRCASLGLQCDVSEW